MTEKESNDYENIENYKKISSRKEQHIEIALSQNVENKDDSWFQCIKLIHQALPEINMEEIDLSVNFLNFKLNSPIMISSITGGTQRSLKINEDLSQIAEKCKIAMTVGSQRIALEHPQSIESFSVVRKYAKNIPIIANIGIQQIINYAEFDAIDKIISMIDANAIAIHLNALQESIQPEGETKLKNGINKIIELNDQLSIPIIIKETGAGISREVGEKLIKNGLKIFDVSGLGGTSFSLVEQYRSKIVPNKMDVKFSKMFNNWGIPTAASIVELRSLSPDIQIIGSGGIRSGIDIAKSITLGANLAGIGLPFLKKITAGQNKAEKYVNLLNKELQVTMFLTGCNNLNKLKKTKKVIFPPLSTWLDQRI